MNYRIFIYEIGSDNKPIVKRDFNNAAEIEDLLEDYEGYYCKIYNLETDKLIMSGEFNDSYLDETYYE